MKLLLFWLLKLSLRLLVFLIVFVGAYLLAAFGLSRIPVNRQPQQPGDDVTIYIRSNGVHTDIVVPLANEIRDWSSSVPAIHTVAADSTMKWLAFGWGDKGFYLETPTWAELKASVAFKAMFFLSSSAMHTTYTHEPLEGEACRKILISKEAYQKLVRYIEESFDKDSSGNNMVVANAHYGDHDAFYDAKRTYNLFYTCNTWANSGLKACGQTACLWTAFDKGIFHWYPLPATR